MSIKTLPDVISKELAEHLYGQIGGVHEVKDRLIEEAYIELRRLARRYLSRERSDHTLQPTALVHEVYLKLAGRQAAPNNHAHFVAIAAQMMRQILINHALAKKAAKRGADNVHISLDPETDNIAAATTSPVDMIALDNALNTLATIDAMQARVVELRYFGGLSIEETAVALSISPATVKREWLTAKVWLKKQLDDMRQ